MMELKITSMTPADRLYAYNQSSQLEGQTGCIGHLRGDFGSGQEFYTSWFDHRSEYKTDEFKAEFDEVVNTLREKDGLLCTRDSMTRFCYQNPEAEFEGNYCAEYGFKVQTPQHTYMLRCNPNYGDYNFYLYAYVSRFLEHHMENAKQGIRLSRPAIRSCSVSPMATTSAFSRAAEEPATVLAGLLTKPILKPAESIPAPFIISANLQSVWSSLTGA